MYAISEKDFCPSMYKDDQLWYKFWTIYIKNADDVQANCLNVKGVS